MADGGLTGEVMAPVRRLEIPFPPGHTILGALTLAEVPVELHPYIVVRLNEVVVTDWAHVMLKDGDRVEFLAYPAGSGGSGSGKRVLGSIMTLAITLAAPTLAPMLVGANASALAVSAATAGISLVGALLVNALIPPPSIGGIGAGVTSTPTAERPTYFFTGQSNEIRLFQKVPRIYGQTRYVPPLAATPQIINMGDSSRVSVLYDFGIGDINITDMRIGSQDVDIVDPEIRVYTNKANPDLDFITRSVAYDQLDYAMDQNTPITLLTNPDAIGAVVDINFPQGLVRLSRNGDRFTHSVGLRIRYRLQGTSSWTTLAASRYSGANKNQQALIFTAEYDVGDITDKDQWNTVWTVVTSTQGNKWLDIRRNGRTIYVKQRSDADSVQALTLGSGLAIRRGIARDSSSNPNGSQYEGYELVVGDAAPNAATVLNKATTSAFVVSASINFPSAGVWEIEVNRLTPVTDVTESNTLRDETRIGMLKSWKRGKVLNLRKPHTMVEIRYTATDKVSGVIQDFNAIASSRLRRFDENGWQRDGDGNVIWGTSSNNAMIAIDLLTGSVAKYPLTSAQIDWPSWSRLRNICNQQVTTTVNGIRTTGPRFRWDGVIESEMTVREAVGAVLANCRAALTLTPAGKWGVLIDEELNTPRQLITPANSWGFSGTRPFVQLPDALRVSFVDRDADYSPADCMVYRDGKNANNTVTVEDVPTTGITSYPEAWRYGRYMMAQGIVRSERFRVSMDVENLAVQRGDLVLVQHDVPAFGGLAFRVVSVNTGLNQVVLDAPIEAWGTKYVVRKNTGQINTGRVTGQLDATTIRVDDASNFATDALVVLDATTSPAEEYIVLGIEPSEDLTAELTLVKYDRAVYTADTGALPDWNPGLGDDIHDKTRVTIDWQGDGLSASWVYIDRIPHLRLLINWQITAGQATYGGANIEASPGNEPWRNVHTVSDSQTQWTFDIPYNDRIWFDGALRIRVTPMNVLGTTGDTIRRDIRLPTYNVKPDPPQTFWTNVRGQEITLGWLPSPSNDVTHYVLRYSPKVTGALWATAQHLARLNYGHTSFTTGARTGTYFISAINAAGKRSDAMLARTTIEELPDINVMEVYNPAPTWPGLVTGFTRGQDDAYSYGTIMTLDGRLMQIAVPVEWDDDLLTIAGPTIPMLTDVDIPDSFLVSHTDWGRTNSTPATYRYQWQVDLTGIFEVRIQSQIEAEAVEAGVFLTTDAASVAMATTPTTTQTARSATVPMALPLRQLSTGISSSQFVDPNESLEDDRDWDCWLEYRAIDELSVIADWVPNIGVLPSMSQGTSEFGPWRRIEVGDATGRIFQFRIVGDSTEPGTLIVVGDGTVELDMADRTWRANDLAVPPSGLTVNFDPAFAAPPIIAVTTEGTGAAIRYQATNLTRTAVTITLYDENGTAVAGQIDLAALGYGRERARGI